MSIKFKYDSDYKYFNKEVFDNNIENYKHLFDFRDPAQKRTEFNKIRNKVLQELLVRDNNSCQIGFENICDKDSGWNVDHYIPLSTNVLNKSLRGQKGKNGKKVKAESYGSNHIDNLILTCANCNSHKKHNIYKLELSHLKHKY